LLFVCEEREEKEHNNMTETDASWGDIEEDEEQAGPRIVDGPEDENGVRERTVFEYITNPETGKRFKVTKKFKVYKRKVKVNQKVQDRIAARRKLKKFGVCEGNPPGVEITNKSISSVDNPQELETVSRRKELREEEATKQEVEKTQDKWTVTNLDPSKVAQRNLDQKVQTIGAEGKYELKIQTKKDETTTVRVTNLSVYAKEEDLRDLFKAFGPISRVYLGIDKKTKLARGFAFINFYNREDAEIAIEKLNRYGYDNLILNVEWAKPSNKYEH